MTSPTPQFGNPAAILFDLDGTLIDSAPDIAAAARIAFDPWLGNPEQALPTALIRSWVGRGSRRLVDDAVDHLSLAARADPAVLLARFAAYYERHPAAHTKVYPGVLATLQQLPQPKAVITNKIEGVARRALKELGLQPLFRDLIGGGSAAPKPAPDMLLDMCKRLNVAPAQALFVGDSRHDVEAARAAGMPVVALTWGYNHGEPVALAQPDAVIDAMEDLLALIDRNP